MTLTAPSLLPFLFGNQETANQNPSTAETHECPLPPPPSALPLSCSIRPQPASHLERLHANHDPRGQTSGMVWPSSLGFLFDTIRMTVWDDADKTSRASVLMDPDHLFLYPVPINYGQKPGTLP